MNDDSSVPERIGAGVTTPHYQFSVNPNDQKSTYCWLLRFSEGARSVLEIGCSTGLFSRQLVARGCHVVGVEQDPASAEQARSVCQRVIVGDIELPEVQAQIREGFEAVVLGDVLEHLRAPEVLLVSARRKWLEPHGRIVLSVPNSGHWVFRREVLRGRFPYRRFGLFDRSHLRFFTRTSLHALVSDAGYVVEQSAFAVNYNCLDDLTFACLAPLYRSVRLRACLVRVEQGLAAVWPTLFAYQFVLCTRPKD